MINLSDEMFSLLKNCLQKHNPSLIPIIELKNYNGYTIDFYKLLREIVGDELISEGFNQDYIPNPYGIKLEKLIDEIGRLFLYT